MSDPILAVEDLNKHFPVNEGWIASMMRAVAGGEQDAVHAVDGVSFELQEGETLGLAGESGCGKTTTGMSLVKLHEPTSGEIRYRGTAFDEMSDADEKSFRQNAQMIFQDPFESLNPRMTVFDTVVEPLRIHDIGNETKRVRRALEFAELEPADQYFDQYPHELSGGQRQRLAIARALVLDPDFIVADEPVSMLDVSLRAGVLSLLERLTEEFGLSVVYISHDLSLLRHMCDRLAIMYMGRIVEIGDTDRVIENPKHPYTQSLIDAVPVPDPTAGRERVELDGEVGDAIEVPSGCRFRTRCPSIIPPDDLSIDQAAFREVSTLRYAVEDGTIDPDNVWDELEADRGDIDAFRIAIREEYLTHDLAGANDTVLEEALTHLANDDRDEAVDALADRFASVCEREDPDAVPRIDVDDDRGVACHLYEPAVGAAEGGAAGGVDKGGGATADD